MRSYQSESHLCQTTCGLIADRSPTVPVWRSGSVLTPVNPTRPMMMTAPASQISADCQAARGGMPDSEDHMARIGEPQTAEPVDVRSRRASPRPVDRSSLDNRLQDVPARDGLAQGVRCLGTQVREPPIW